MHRRRTRCTGMPPGENPQNSQGALCYSELVRLPAIYLNDLTQAQRRLTLDLCSGYTVEEIAQRRGRSISTLRNHLKVIYARYAITRQHQLVAAVLVTNGAHILSESRHRAYASAASGAGAK